MTTSPPLLPPRAAGMWALPDRSPFAPDPAVVETASHVEAMASVAGGFVVDWQLGALTSEQQ